MSRATSQQRAAQRLNLCFDMFELGTEMMRQKLRREHPDANEDEIRSRYLAWLHHRPGAEHGDGVGRPVSWPRRRR